MVDFEKNMPLVYHIFNKYYYTLERYKQDLIQCGMLGLWKACLKFDETKQTQFSTLASKCIRNEMNCFLRSELKHWYNTTDYMIMQKNGEKVNILELTEDCREDRKHDEMNLRLCLEKGTLIQELAKGKTQVQIAKESGKSMHQVQNILMKEKKDLKEMLK